MTVASPPLVITIPTLPARVLAGNGSHGGSHHAVSAARRALREATYYAIRAEYASPPAYDVVRVSVLMRSTRKQPRDGLWRGRDPWNLAYACKSLVDGIVDAGIVADDTYEHVRVGDVGFETVGELRDEGIVVTVEAVS